MKTPAELCSALKKQWHNPKLRSARLLEGDTLWPICLPIGQPKPSTLRDNLDLVVEHNKRWKNVSIGQVRWEYVSYRAAAEPVKVPVRWQLDKPSEWISACNDSAIASEFSHMATLVEHTDSIFHSLLLKRRTLWQQKPIEEVLQACELALALEPACANGKPLRSLPLVNIDTKFFERHRRLITILLDERFQGEASLHGLEEFLDAIREDEHWVLLLDLDGDLLPFHKQRVTTTELASIELPGQHVLIVENQSCQHQLPAHLSDTVVILGAGFDLDWTKNQNLAEKSVAYWGDLDTWGLSCLAKARKHLPNLQPLLMTQAVFDQFKDAAVVEPIIFSSQSPTDLNSEEIHLYQHLLGCDFGRLEQEYIDSTLVKNTIALWHNSFSLP